MAWTILVEAPDQLTAELLEDILLQEGIPARLAPQDVASYLGPSPMPCRLMVPEEEAQHAAETLMNAGFSLDFSLR